MKPDAWALGWNPSRPAGELGAHGVGEGGAQGGQGLKGPQGGAGILTSTPGSPGSPASPGFPGFPGAPFSPCGVGGRGMSRALAWSPGLPQGNKRFPGRAPPGSELGASRQSLGPACSPADSAPTGPVGPPRSLPCWPQEGCSSQPSPSLGCICRPSEGLAGPTVGPPVSPRTLTSWA